MLSLGKFPDWSVFKEREEMALEAELISPAAEVASILNMNHAILLQAQQATAQERAYWLEVLAQQASLVAQLAMVLDRYESSVAQLAQESQPVLTRWYRSLRIVKDQMLDELQRNGLEVEVPVGKPFDEVSEAVQVEGWRHHQDFTAEIVVEVIEPVVRYKETLLRQGRVVMGAPLEEAEPEAERIS